MPEVKFPAKEEIESRAEHTLVAEFTVKITVESLNVAVRQQKVPVSGIWLLPANINSYSFTERHTTQIKKKIKIKIKHIMQNRAVLIRTASKIPLKYLHIAFDVQVTVHRDRAS